MSPEAASPVTLARLGLAVSILLALAGRSHAVDAEHAVETLLEQAHSGLGEKRREVIRDATAWARLWAEIHAGESPAPAPPPVDFARHMLVAVATGTRPSGGYAIRVRSVVVRGEKLEVAVLETCPAPGAMVSMGLTQPVEVVRVPNAPQPASFQEVRAGACR